MRDAAIRKMVELYFEPNTVEITGYGFDMLYAGPREAVLHAVFRQNMGATHLIVGAITRAWATTTAPFDAQEIFRREVPTGALELEIFEADHTAFSKVVGEVIMMREAPEGHKKEDFVFLSGTKVREMLSDGEDSASRVCTARGGQDSDGLLPVACRKGLRPVNTTAEGGTRSTGGVEAGCCVNRRLSGPHGYEVTLAKLMCGRPTAAEHLTWSCPRIPDARLEIRARSMSVMENPRWRNSRAERWQDDGDRRGRVHSGSRPSGMRPLPLTWRRPKASRTDRGSLEGGQLLAGVLSRVQHGADDPQALQGDGFQAEGDLRPVSERPRQGCLQGGRASEADRLRVSRRLARSIRALR